MFRNAIKKGLQYIRPLITGKLIYKDKSNLIYLLDKFNGYEDNLKDTNTFKATPMSSMQEGRNYNTSVTDIEGKHSGYAIANSNVFKNINDVLGEHSEVVNNFINEFDYLFMGVL